MTAKKVRIFLRRFFFSKNDKFFTFFKAFSNKSLLIQHKRGYHGLRIGDRKISEPYICDFCGKEYWTRSSIVTHLLVTHKTLADFKCHLCCRTFKSHGNLSRHIKIHNNDKSFGCEKCGAMFKEKYQLEIHIHNHDERKIL